MKKSEVCAKIVADYILLALFIYFIVFLLPKAIVFFMPIVIGYVISLLANPIVRFLEEKVKLVRKHGSALVIVFVIAVVSLIIYGIGYLLISQINNIITDLPQLFGMIERRVNEIGHKLSGIFNSMPYSVRNYIFAVGENVGGNNILGNIASFGAAKTTIVNVTNMLLYFIFTIMSAYYFTAERDKIMCRVRLLLPGHMMFTFKKVMQNFYSIIGDYIKVQLKIMIILIGILYIGLKVFNIKYAFILAFVIGVLDILPLLGVGCVLIPWAIGALILNEIVLGVELIILYIICVSIREIAEPKMFSKRIGISAFATFFLLYIGLKLGGLIGVIISIPVGIISINLYKAGAFDMLIENTKYIYNEIGRARRKIDDFVVKENKNNTGL